MMNKMFGRNKNKDQGEKPLAAGWAEYMGGHKAYPKRKWSGFLFYEDRFIIEELKLTVPYAKIKDISNTNEKRREADRLALAVIALPLALAYLVPKNHTYTIIEYEDELDTQRIIVDFGKGIDSAQSLIYRKMLALRTKTA